MKLYIVLAVFAQFATACHDPLTVSRKEFEELQKSVVYLKDQNKMLSVEHHSLVKGQLLIAKMANDSLDLTRLGLDLFKSNREDIKTLSDENRLEIISCGKNGQRVIDGITGEVSCIADSHNVKDNSFATTIEVK